MYWKCTAHLQFSADNIEDILDQTEEKVHRDENFRWQKSRKLTNNEIHYVRQKFEYLHLFQRVYTYLQKTSIL